MKPPPPPRQSQKGSGLAAGSLRPAGASGEVGGSQHDFACCCPGPEGPGRGRRSAVGGAVAVWLRTLSLLMRGERFEP